jgi:beta-glucosidase
LELATHHIMALRFLVLALALPLLSHADVITGIPDAAPPGFEEWESPVIVPAANTSASGLGNAGWAAALQKARVFVRQLTLEEKINVTTGTDIFNRCVGNTGVFFSVLSFCF